MQAIQNKILDKLKIGFLVLILLHLPIVFYGQTESTNESKCVKVWEVDCNKVAYITEVLALWPTTLQYTKELKDLNSSQKTKYTAQIDSLKTVHKKEIKRQVRKKNINKIGIVAGFLLALLIK